VGPPNNKKEEEEKIQGAKNEKRKKTRHDLFGAQRGKRGEDGT